jgi:PST family polysaccharide transporter
LAGKKKLIYRHLSLTSISSVLFSLSQIIIQLIVIRNSSISEYGVFAFTYSIFSVFDLLVSGYSSDISLQIIGRNSVSSKIHEQTDTLSLLFTRDIKAHSIGFGIALFIGFFLSFTDNFSFLYYSILLFGTIFNIGYSSIKSILIAYNLIELQTKYELICIFMSLFLGICFTLIGGATGYVISLSVYIFLKLIVGYYIISTKGLKINNIIKGLFSRKSLQVIEPKMVFFSILRNGLVNLTNQLDMLLLGVLPFSSSVIAQYKVAKTLSGLPAKIVYPVWAAIRGRMVEAYYNKNFIRLKSLILKPTLVFLFVFLFVFVFCYFTADQMVILLYGKEYLFSAQIFIILLCGSLILQLISNWFNFWVIIANKNQHYITSLVLQIVFLVFATLFIDVCIIKFSICVAISMILGAVLQLNIFLSNLKVDSNHYE